MKSVLMSIQPKWCKRIADGSKTIEVRKTAPKIATPFKVYIYETKDKKFENIGIHWANGKTFEHNIGKVIGEFVCDKVERIAHCGTCNNDIRLNIVDKNFYCKALDYEYLNKCKLSYSEIEKYSNGGDVYGWHISNLVIYEKPRELSEFIRICPEWEKGEITDKCLECEHLYRSPIENLIDCDYEGEVPITRPPQSWCYVESEGDTE